MNEKKEFPEVLMNKINKSDTEPEHVSESKSGSSDACVVAQTSTSFYVKKLSEPVLHSQARVSHPRGGPTIKVNQYTLKDIVGRGSFAQVYIATGPGDIFSDVQGQYRNRKPPTLTYAVKVINKSALKRKRDWKKTTEDGTPQLVSLFDRVLVEIDIWSRLRCRNIIGLKEILDHEPAGNIYLIMEMAKLGQIMQWHPNTLTYRCPRLEENIETIPHELARHYFRDAGIYYLHSLGIVHRDIKPENILVTHFHECKLCDFGESIFIKKSKRNPQGLLTATAGTHQFFAPECCRDPAADTDSSDNQHKGTGISEIEDASDSAVSFSGFAVDMWACGVSLFACIFGCLPFYASESAELFALIGRAEIRWPEFRAKLEKKVSNVFSMKSIRPIFSKSMQSSTNQSFPALSHGSFVLQAINPSWSDSMKQHTLVQLNSMLNFMQQLLAPTPDHRLTVFSAIKDPWLTFDNQIPLQLSPIKTLPPPIKLNRSRGLSAPASVSHLRRNSPAARQRVRSERPKSEYGTITKISGPQQKSCSLM